MSSMSEKIRILLIKKGNMSITDLAKLLKTTPQNLNGKMKRDNFSQKELQQIAEVLDCDYKSSFIIRKTGEEI